MATKRDGKTEVYSRVCGFFRPVQQWKRGKKEEFKEHSEYVCDLQGANSTENNLDQRFSGDQCARLFP